MQNVSFTFESLELVSVYNFSSNKKRVQYKWLVGWSCFTSHRQRGHLETAPPFCEGCEARVLHRSHRESNPGPSRGSPLHYRCATPAPQYYTNNEWL